MVTTSFKGVWETDDLAGHLASKKNTGYFVGRGEMRADKITCWPY